MKQFRLIRAQLHLSLASILFMAVLSILKAQSGLTMQGSVRITAGPADSTLVTVYAKAGQSLTNAVFENINICISIPDQGAANPVVSVNRNFIPSVDWTYAGLNFPDVTGGRALYTFISNDNESNLALNWPADTEIPIVEFRFKGGTGRVKVQLNDLTTSGGIGSGGGPSSQSFWYVQINTKGDVTNYQEKFFKTASTSSPVNGGTNSPSYVETADELVLSTYAPENLRWDLYPNPTSHRIHIIPGISGLLEFRLMNTAGMQVFDQKRDVQEGQASTFDLQDVTDGMYQLEVLQPGQRIIFSKKVMVKR